MKKLVILLILSLSSIHGKIFAGNGEESIGLLRDSIRQAMAPDKRTAIFSVSFILNDGTVSLNGETTVPDACNIFVRRLREMGYSVSNEIRLLPDGSSLGAKDRAIVNVSACNLRSEGDYDAPQSSQALLGMPLRLLQKDDWLQVQTPDGYISWVLPSTVHRVTQSELTEWNTSKQIVVTSLYGLVYTRPDLKSETVGDICAGNRLKLIGNSGNFFYIAYPDGRTGYVSKADAKELQAWRNGMKRDAQSIISTGRRLKGLPYMWGGTSTKGVDCSGFVRTTLLMHDIIIPRDASQQAYKGEHIDIAEDFNNLQPGDLLFFGQKATDERPARVHHVAIYTGNKRFIHSLGFVHESSFSPEDEDYDAYDLRRLLWAERILPYINKEKELNTTDQNSFYK